VKSFPTEANGHNIRQKSVKIVFFINFGVIMSLIENIGRRYDL